MSNRRFGRRDRRIGDGLEEQIESLLRLEPSDRAHRYFAVSESQLEPGRSPQRGIAMEGLVVDAIQDHRDALRFRTTANQLVPDVARHRDEAGEPGEDSLVGGIGTGSVPAASGRSSREPSKAE